MDRQIQPARTEFIVENHLFGDVTRVPGDEVSEAETVPENLGDISGLTQFVMSKLPVRQPAS